MKILLNVFCKFQSFPTISALVSQSKESALQETQVQSLDWEDPLEKGMATHFSTLAWKIPWTEEPGGLQSMGLQRVGRDLEIKSQGEMR